MNSISLNNLWSYLQGLTLTASNKRWLADHLYEFAQTEEMPLTREEAIVQATQIRKEKEMALRTNLKKVKKEELKISQWVDDIVKDIEPMPENVDVEKLKLDYLMEKYR